MEKKLLISGASGFLGRSIMRVLTEEKDRGSVIALSRSVASLERYSGLWGVRILENREFLNIDQDLTGYTLINLAYSRSSDFEQIKSSCQWTMDLLVKAQEYGLARVINISSQSLYDPCRRSPARESDLPRLSSLYDMGKYYMENWVRDFADRFGILYLNLRIASLVGPGLPQRVTSRLVRQAMESGSISVNLNGQLLSYTHVEDMARAIVMAAGMTADRFWNRLYNVASEETYRIGEIVRVMVKIFSEQGRPLKINRLPADPSHRNSSMDSSLFRKETGWQPVYTLEDVIEEACKESADHRVPGMD